MAGQTTTKTIRKCSIWDHILTLALLCFGAVSFITFGPYIDEKFPVVEPLVVTKQELKGDQMVISGWLYKRRNCERIAVLAYVKFTDKPNTSLTLDFYDNTMQVSRPEGVSEWGPWVMVLPAGAKQVELYSSHRCHPFWVTQTKLGVVYER